MNAEQKTGTGGHRGPRLLLGGMKLAAPLVLILGAIALALAVLKPVPEDGQAGPRNYATIEDAESALGVQLLSPGYFPDYLRWPAATVQGRRAPYPQADMTFVDRTSGKPSLWLHQEISTSDDWKPALPGQASPGARAPIDIGDYRGWMIMYRDTEGVEYGQLLWRQGDRLLSLTGVYPEPELLRMARTMAP